MMEISFSRHHPRPAPPVTPQSFGSVVLDNFSFIPNGATPVTVGNVVIVMSPTSPASTATVALGGADAASFQLTNGGVYPCALQAKAATGAGTYSITLTATQAGVTNSPFVYGPVTITGATAFLLQTLTLVNTSGSTQIANVPTNFIGVQFKKGDIAAGTAPQFKQGGTGTVQPFSWGLQSYWSDGSLRTCAVVLRPTFSVTTNQTVEVWSGGSAPASSGRSLSEIYSQLLQVNVTIATQSTGTSGNYTAQFISNSNNLEQLTYLDGGAGLFVRMLANFVPANSSFVPTSSTAHGRLVCYAYIGALNDGSGSLGGFTFLPRITQPFYNVSGSPAGGGIGPRAFTTCQWQYGSGPTVTSFAFPFGGAVNFNWQSVQTFQLASGTHNWYQGGQSSSIGCTISGASLPTTSPQINTTSIFYINVNNGSPNNQFGLSVDSNGYYEISGSANNGGGSIRPLLVCNTFGSVWGALDDANLGPVHNYFQGAGSIAARTTLRHQIDQTYVQGTKLVQPWDLSLIGSVNDNSPWTYSWCTTNIGPFTVDPQPTGDGPGFPIGWTTPFAAAHFYNQSANSERINRFIGFAAANRSIAFKDATSRSIPNLGNPGVSFTGFPSSQYNVLTWGFNYTLPPSTDSVFCFNYGPGPDYSHSPDFLYWQYLRFGDPQFYDMLIEGAHAALMQVLQADRQPVAIAPGYYAQFANWNIQQRTMGWLGRDITVAAICAAGTSDGSVLDPQGLAMSKYWNTIVTDNCTRLVGMLNTSNGYNSYFATNKYPIPIDGDYGSTQLLSNAVPWQRAYNAFWQMLAAGALENSNALARMGQEMTWYLHVFNSIWGSGQGGFGITFAFFDRFGPWVGGNQWPGISSDAEYAFTGTMNGNVSWVISSGSPPRRFSCTVQPGATVSNNDRFYWDTRFSTPAGLANPADPMFVINVTHTGSNYSFDLSTTVGGSAFVTTDANSNGPYVHPTTPVAATTPGAAGDPAHFCEVRAVMRMLKALDPTFATIPDISALMADFDTRATTDSISTLFPNWAVYAIQTSFA